MSIIVENIEHLTESNIGGVLSIEIIDVNLCPTFNTISHEVNENLQLNLNHWMKIIPSRDSIQFSCTPKSKSRINLYVQEISMTVPKHRLEIDRRFTKMLRTRFVALIRGANNTLLVGSKDAPLKFELVDIRYKEKSTQKNSYRIKFSVLSQNTPVFYTNTENVNTPPPIPSYYMYWENGTLAQWEDGTQREFEN
jgi:hypothetical protein